MKNSIKILSLITVLPVAIMAQGGLVNNGVSLKITASTDLKIDGGGVLNQANGQIENEGNLYLDQNWDQLGTSTTYTGNGWMWYEGTANQSVSSVSPLVVPRLRVDNGQRLILQNNVTVSTQVDLMNNGSIQLDNNNLVMSSGATMVNYDVNNYIITNSTGHLEQQVASTQVVFPVGNSSYNPAFLTNNGTVDNFNVRVENQALETYPSGTIDFSDIVQRAWMIDEQVSGGSDVSMTLQWDTPQEVLDFNRSVSGIAHWDNGSWNYPIYTPAVAVGVSWQQSLNGISSFSPFVVNDETDFLPIELLLFEAQRLNISTVRLDWITTEELDNRGFEIQRMHDYQSSFEVVGWKDANSEPTSFNSYQYEDPNSYEGLSYYRFKQIDYSGEYSYSPVRVVSGIKTNESVAVYPNPATNNLYIRFSDISAQTVIVKIYAIDGKLLYSQSMEIEQNTVIDLDKVEQLIAGVYHLQLIFDDVQPKNFEFIKK